MEYLLKNRQYNRGFIRLKRLKSLAFLFTTLLAGGICYLIADLYIYGGKPASPDKREKIITVNPGQNFISFTDNLFNSGIIKNPNKFKFLARVKKLDKKLKAGEYVLSPSIPPNEILDIIVSSRVLLHKVTVPEGYNLYQIATLIEKEALGTKNDFLRAATDPAIARRMNTQGNTSEGYLFPDTYHFPKGITSEKIIAAMVKRFHSVFDPKWKQRAEALGFSVHQIITLASIIEKETGADFERPIISSVFHNRLKKRMRLETDPTVIYGIENFDGNITRKHLRTRTPYNTYKIRGLPPGPIANPGIDAIKAALYPAETKFLYFVSKKDTTHQFSTNIVAHNQAVRKYQLRR